MSRAAEHPAMRAIHWFRSDLRIEDNTALGAAGVIVAPSNADAAAAIAVFAATLGHGR